MTFHIGFTGSRETVPRAVADAIKQKIYELAEPWDRVAFHHGCCDGADAFAHYVTAHSRKIDEVYLHWPIDRKYCTAVLQVSRKCASQPPRSYRGRNIKIVHSSHVLVAAPRWPEDDPRSERSGTWMTIRMARVRKIPVHIIEWWNLDD